MKSQQFGIRSILFLVAICAVVALWVGGWMRHQQARQAEWTPSNPSSVRVTVETGIPQHTFSYDGPAAAGRFELDGDKTSPDSRSNLLELDRFSDMSSLKLTHVQLDTNATNQLKSMSQLRSLRLEKSTIPKDLIEQLGGLPLERLDLVECNISDEMLGKLNAYTKLEILVLKDNRLSDASLRSLEQLTDLKILDVRGNPITSAAATAFERSVPDCKLAYDDADPE